jgi:hypothetical protein
MYDTKLRGNATHSLKKGNRKRFPNPGNFSKILKLPQPEKIIDKASLNVNKGVL